VVYTTDVPLIAWSYVAVLSLTYLAVEFFQPSNFIGGLKIREPTRTPWWSVFKRGL